jgi:glycosyltransferase involved in cell wall biosynthesis
MSSEHRVSLIIPCFRDSATLARAIDSVKAQTRQVDEIVVVNDCSPETAQIEQVLRNYPLVVYVRNASNLGLAATRNVGISVATGDVVSFLDADDELHPQKIEFQLSLLRDGAVVACGVRIIRGGQSTSGYPQYSEMRGVRTVTDDKRLMFQNFLTGASLMASRELLLSVGGYDETFRSCEDFDLWFRLIEHGVMIFQLKMPLYFYYFNPLGLSKNLQSISQWEIEVLKRHFSREINCQYSRSLQPIVWAIWLCKHFARAEIAGDKILRERTLENVPHLVAWPLLAALISTLGRMRIFLPYSWVLQVSGAVRRKTPQAS